MRAAAAGVVAVVAFALVAVVPAAALPTGFRSPTGNISCLFVPATHDDARRRLQAQVLCTIAHSAYGSMLQDKCLNPLGQVGSGVDWHGFSLGATRRGSIVCSGGVLYNPTELKPSYVTLRYGTAMRRGPITCRSKTAGITCLNRSGHGVFVSRESWRAW